VVLPHITKLFSLPFHIVLSQYLACRFTAGYNRKNKSQPYKTGIHIETNGAISAIL